MTRVGTRASFRPRIDERSLLRTLREDGVWPDARAAPAPPGTAAARRTRRRRGRGRRGGEPKARVASRCLLRTPRARARRAPSDSVSNFRASDGDSGSAYRVLPTMSSFRFIAPPAFASSASMAEKTTSSGCTRRPRRQLRPRAARGAPRRRRTARSPPPSASRSPGGTSSPFSPSRTTSGTPPTVVAITGQPDGERLDDRVREVLPRRREHRRVGGAEEAQHRSRGDAAEKARARVEPELAGLALERGCARDRPRRRRASRRASAPAPRGRCRAPSAARADRRRRARRPRARARARSSSRTAAPGSRARGSAAPSTRAGSRPQPRAISRRYALGQKT